VKDFHHLKVWRKAHELTLAVYQITARSPRDELYGLTAQLRRCSASVPANLAEGCGRDSDADFARFCVIAIGSASELEYHLLLAKDLGFIDQRDHVELSQRATELKRMLKALRKKGVNPKSVTLALQTLCSEWRKSVMEQAETNAVHGRF
jgi:four helix bundle protein